MLTRGTETGEPGDSKNSNEAGDPPGCGEGDPGAEEEENDRPERRADLPTHLPLSEYLSWCVKQHRLCAASPLRFHVWRSPLWTFARLAKAHDELNGLTRGQAFRRIEGVLKDWCKQLGRKGE